MVLRPSSCPRFLSAPRRRVYPHVGFSRATRTMSSRMSFAVGGRPREYGLWAPGMTERLRVTTDPEYFEENAESLELWAPGNPLFTPPEFTPQADEPPAYKTLKDILDG